MRTLIINREINIMKMVRIPFLAGMRRTLSSRNLVLILMLSAALNITGIWWGLPHLNDVWEPDQIAGTSVLGRMYYRFSTQASGFDYRYPPLHFVVSAAFYTPYLAYSYLMGGSNS